WRVLALRQPIDAVVEEHDHDVHVAAQNMQEMIAADAQAVTVAGDDPDLEVWPRGLEPGGDRGGTPVDAMETVGVHVIRQPAAAADAGDEDDLLARDAEIRHQLLRLREDRVVAAARAPADLLVRDKIFARQRNGLGHCFGRHPTVTLLRTSSLTFCSICAILNGRPVTCLRPTAPT